MKIIKYSKDTDSHKGVEKNNQPKKAKQTLHNKPNHKTPFWKSPTTDSKTKQPKKSPAYRTLKKQLKTRPKRKYQPPNKANGEHKRVLKATSLITITQALQKRTHGRAFFSSILVHGLSFEGSAILFLPFFTALFLLRFAIIFRALYFLFFFFLSLFGSLFPLFFRSIFSVRCSYLV